MRSDLIGPGGGVGVGFSARHDYHVLSTAMWNAYPERLISDNGLPMEANFYNQDIYTLPCLSR